MSDYFNPAGRLWIILKKLSQKPTGSKDQLAACFGVNNDWNSIFSAIQDIEQEFILLEKSINLYRENQKKHTLLSSKLPDIKSSCLNFSIDMKAGSYSVGILAGAVVSLEFMAADLPQEVELTRDELSELRRLCDEMQESILQCKDLNKTLREWLLDLVRMMRDGIDRYGIRGKRGLRRQFHEMLGSMCDHYEEVEELKQKAPSVWKRMSDGFEKFNKFSEFAEKASKAIENLAKFSAFLHGSGSPPMLGN